MLPSLKGKDTQPSRTRPASKPIDLTLILQHIRLFEVSIGQSEFRDISYTIYAILKFSVTQTFDILVIINIFVRSAQSLVSHR